LGGDAVLVATEVDQPVAALVAPATMARRDLALVIAAAGADLWPEQRLFRLGTGSQLGKVAHRRSAATRRCRIVFADTHDLAVGFGLSALGQALWLIAKS